MAETNVPPDLLSGGTPIHTDVAPAPLGANGSPSKSRRRSSTIPKNQEDTETCRICRSEGTPVESLFYPCRCSGSIKYVHQDCLMEWLSHSQKKYCELCQTPFRFTKLYHPHMPKALPTTVFVGKAISHTLRWLVTWARAGLVCLVWLVALPYAMRMVWRTLFWIADGGWARDRYIGQLAGRLPLQDATRLRQVREPTRTGSHTAGNSTLVTMATLLQPLFRNTSTDTPGILSLLGRILSIGATENVGIAENSTAHDLLVRRLDSLLSEVSVLQNLTKWPSLNRKVIDILEGLTITLSVVVAFILIFLIREWVVQQQPLLNAQVANEDDVPIVRAQAAEVVNAEPAGDAVPAEAEEAEDPLDLAGHLDPDLSQQDREDYQRRVQDGTDSIRGSTNESAGTASASTELPAEQDPGIEDSGMMNGNRPRLERGKATLANEVYRDLEEEEVIEPTTALLPLHPPNSVLQEPPSVPESSGQDSGSSAATMVGALTTSQDQWSFASISDERQSPPKAEQQCESEISTSQHPEAASRTTGLYVLPDGHQEDQETAGVPVPQVRDAPLDRAAEDWAVLEGDEPLAAEPAQGMVDREPNNTGLLDHTAALPAEPPRFADRLINFLYGDLGAYEPQVAAAEEDLDQDDEHVVQNFDDEEPFVAFEDNHMAAPQLDEAADRADNADQEPVQDPEVAAAAAEAGIDVNDQDAIDDAEDLEGILELIGMQGPLTGLFQNALFSAVLIALTVAGTAWGPYLWGKSILLFMGSPVSLGYGWPIKAVDTIAGFLADVSLLVIGGILYMLTSAMRLLYTVVMQMDTNSLDGVLRPARSISGTALQRLSVSTGSAAWPADKDYLHASIVAHAALLNIEQEGRQVLSSVANCTRQIYSTAVSGSPMDTASLITTSLIHIVTTLFQSLAATEITIPTSFSFVGFNRTSTAVASGAQTAPFSGDPLLVFWSAWDRFLTIGLAYLSFAVAGSFYLSWSPPLFSTPRIRRFEQALTDILIQAGGVLKVILIISIEMMAFPLFCGFLLDFALMPLFENASIDGRFAFAIGSPWISGFVHWFVGTCYMFHFALFVSMCRKIMRPGVLYFIRDPDDPTFHPVRDVLERSVATQLRKIAFSAIVYGALIILCLGGVVWGLWAIFDGVLPLHWSSSKSALEFPLDILFYNFLTPLVLRHAKPSDALHAMYKWWFRRCARFLRLSDFLFGERLSDEEGHPVGISYLETSLRFVRPWKGQEKVMSGEQSSETDFKKTGRYVRAPATDQVRIAKGESVFVPVDEHNRRLDGRLEEEGVHSLDSDQTKMVYIPPWFTARISAFVLTIWLFAAVTGCGMTVVPLIVGRRMCYTIGIVENGVRVNDIYAFSLGMYTLGGLIFAALRLRKVSGWARDRGRQLRSSIPAKSLVWQAVKDSRMPLLQAARVLYVYSALLAVLPLVFSAILELYLLLPLHTFSTGSSNGEPPSTGSSDVVTQHHVHIVQDWTLGVLYTRIAMKLIQWNPNSILARAARAVTAQRGPLNPSAALATRYFIIPCAALATIIIHGPYNLACIANRTLFAEHGAEVQMLVCRLAYPLCSALAAGAYSGWLLMRATERWRGLIRDEVYLVGERLHNFGEKRSPTPTSAGRPVGVAHDTDVLAAEVGA